MNGPIIHFPTAEENAAAMREFLQREKRVNQERLKAAVMAMPALKRLCRVMCERSGQCYKIRALLYSIWNGKPVELIEVLGLDWELRQDICAVILAFGFEGQGVEFFYSELENQVRAVNQWNWFLEERLNVEKLAEYLAAAKEAE